MRKRLIIGVLGLMIAFSLTWEFVPLQETRWVGGFTLSVDVVAEGEPPNRVSCQIFHRREHAEEMAQLSLLPDKSSGDRIVIVDPFDGKPLTINVKSTGRSSPLNRDLSYTQSRCLAVVAEWPDGRKVTKLVEIPDGRKSRSIRVALP